MAVLLVKTIKYPLSWTIEVTDYDFFGRPAETVGRCDGQERLAFLVTFLAINFVAMVFLAVEAWKTRNLSTEYSESRYIAIVMLSIFLVAFVGGPVLVLAYDNPDASIFVGNTIIFLACCSTLLWIFLPKVFYQWNDEHHSSNNLDRRGSTTAFHFGGGSTDNFFGASNEFVVDDSLRLQRADPNHNNNNDYGTRVSDRRTLDALEDEIIDLRRRLAATISSTGATHHTPKEAGSSSADSHPSAIASASMQTNAAQSRISDIGNSTPSPLPTSYIESYTETLNDVVVGRTSSNDDDDGYDEEGGDTIAPSSESLSDGDIP